MPIPPSRIRLRTRIASGFAIIILPLVVISIVALATIDQLGRSVDTVLVENERSLAAATDMDIALERLDSAALLVLLGRDDEAQNIARQANPAFKRALQIASGNLTIDGEGEVTSALSQSFGEAEAAYERVTSAEPDARREIYAQSFVPAFEQSRSRLAELRTLNREAAQTAGQEAGNAADTARWTVLIGALVALLLCIWVTIKISGEIAGDFPRDMPPTSTSVF